MKFFVQQERDHDGQVSKTTGLTKQVVGRETFSKILIRTAKLYGFQIKITMVDLRSLLCIFFWSYIKFAATKRL